jgi:hypothetical protein
MNRPKPIARSKAALHVSVPLPKGYTPRRKKFGIKRLQMMFRGFMQTIGIAQPPSVDLFITTVSLGCSFDAYLHASFEGSPQGAEISLLLDSGNTVLVVPRWEDIESIPDWSQSYKILGQAEEPWGCPANVVEGPIQLATTDGGVFTIDGCVFLACTGDSPQNGSRTANFGAGCIEPWSASAWNAPAVVASPIKSPLAYVTSYPFAEFDYAGSDDIFASTNPQGVSEQSTLRLYAVAPDGYDFLQIVRDCVWMALRPKQLQIAGTLTHWPDPNQAAIAMIDSGGTCVYLSDPTNLVYRDPWPAEVPNPQWSGGSTNCMSTKASLTVGLVDDTGASFTYDINEAALPPSDQGLTLVMCQMNEFMMGQYGMNIGGISALVVRILVDYASGRVGLRCL